MKKTYFLSMFAIFFTALIIHAQTANVGNSGSGGHFTNTWVGDDGLYYALNHVASNQEQNLVIYQGLLPLHTDIL